MPFKTQYGSHYHMVEGCHGADIPCGTEGLTPCAICGGAGSNSDDPNRNDTAGVPIGTVIAMDDDLRFEHERRHRESAPSETYLGRTPVTEKLPDDDDDGPFGDGGAYSRYGSSDHFPEAPAMAQRDIGVADKVTEAGLASANRGMGAPSVGSTEELTDRLASSSYGVPESEWDDDTRRVTETGCVPEGSDFVGRAGSLYVFETGSVSTSNPNDSGDRRGEWLYDYRSAVVIAPDGTNLTNTLRQATNLRKSVEEERRKFDEKCLRAAQEQAGSIRLRRRDASVAEAVRDAREAYERDVLAPWKRGLDGYIARSMEESPKDWAGDGASGRMERSLRRRYERSNPRPAPWNYGLPEYQEARAKGMAEADRQLQAEGWDYEEETKRRLASVKRIADPDGTGGVPPRMLENYEHAMGVLAKYPDSIPLVGEPLTWGTTMGMPVKLPERWRRRLRTGE